MIESRLERIRLQVISTTEFSGDNNRMLKIVQHSARGEMVTRLFVAARDRYLAAVRLIRVDNELAARLRSMNGFDHRILQSAHDRIATYFRFKSPASTQLQLGEDDCAFQKRLEVEWRQFFIAEIERLTADDEFTRAVCTATAIGSEDAGLTAEKWLVQFLMDRYAL